MDLHNPKSISVGAKILIRLTGTSPCMYPSNNSSVLVHSVSLVTLQNTNYGEDNKNGLYDDSGLQLKELQDTNCPLGGELRQDQKQKDKKEDIGGI